MKTGNCVPDILVGWVKPIQTSPGHTDTQYHACNQTLTSTQKLITAGLVKRLVQQQKLWKLEF